MKILKNIFALLMLFSGILFAQISSGSLTTFAYVSDRTTPLMSAWSDVNGDGDIDVAIASRYNGYPWIRVLKNDASSLWTYTGGSSGTAKWVDFGDVDNDGDYDLAAAAGSYAWVFKDNGSTLSASPDWSKALTNAHCVSWGNYNNDDYLDLAVAVSGYVYIFDGQSSGIPSTTAGWYWNFGSGTVISLSFGILDDDDTEENQSLAVGIAGTGVYVFENTGSTLPASASWSNANFDGCVLADFDNDNDDDLFTNYSDYWNEIDARVYLSNNGSITANYYNAVFDEEEGNASGSNMVVADFNSDGYNDLAMKSAVNASQYSAYTGTSIYYNDAGTGFKTDYFIIPHGDTPLPQDHYADLGNVTAADLDNDGDFELFFGSHEEDYDVSGWPWTLNWERIYLSYFENEGDAAPAPPKNLSIYEPYLQNPVLSWDANTEADFKEYKVYRTGTDYDGGGWNNIATTTNTSYTDNQVYCGGHDVTVSYKLKAVDDANNYSNYSNTKSIWVLYKPPVIGDDNDPEKIQIPTEFSVSQNYPNPFNPETNITFGLPQDNFVNLVVYNIHGEKVARLVNEQLAAGSYTAKFDGSLLPSGVYIYRIQAGSFSQIKRMLLIK